MSTWERVLLKQIRTAGLAEPVRGFRFAAPRRWRFGLCWPDRRLAVEAQGATWGMSRLARGLGLAKGCEKYSAAAVAGWTVLRFNGQMVRDGHALEVLRVWLDGAGDFQVGQSPVIPNCGAEASRGKE